MALSKLEARLIGTADAVNILIDEMTADNIGQKYSQIHKVMDSARILCCGNDSGEPIRDEDLRQLVHQR
ncbi:MAG: hypothetical protein LBT92_04215 [Rickettsiales bacterium]|jgi:hypothetical protein|nr:hypothetical protein [Rickettsiales bacterium]